MVALSFRKGSANLCLALSLVGARLYKSKLFLVTEYRSLALARASSFISKGTISATAAAVTTQQNRAWAHNHWLPSTTLKLV